MLANHSLASARTFVEKNLQIRTPMEPAARRKLRELKCWVTGSWTSLLGTTFDFQTKETWIQADTFPLVLNTVMLAIFQSSLHILTIPLLFPLVMGCCTCSKIPKKLQNNVNECFQIFISLCPHCSEEQRSMGPGCP